MAIGRILRKARMDQGLSQPKAAARANMTQQKWSMIERGEQTLDVIELEIMAQALDLDRESILREAQRVSGPPILQPSTAIAFPPASQSMPLRGRVQAGAWLAAEDDLDQDEPRRIPAAYDPRFPRDAQYLCEIVGDSMNLARIFDGDLAHLVDIQAIGYQPISGDIVEVERLRFSGRERELSLKELEVLPDGRALLWPRSSNPRWREPIDSHHGAPEGEELQWRVRGLLLAVIRRF